MQTLLLNEQKKHEATKENKSGSKKRGALGRKCSRFTAKVIAKTPTWGLSSITSSHKVTLCPLIDVCRNSRARQTDKTAKVGMSYARFPFDL